MSLIQTLSSTLAEDESNQTTKPQKLNHHHYIQEAFPEILGFCEKTEIGKEYSLNEKKYIYTHNQHEIYHLQYKDSLWKLDSVFEKNIIESTIGSTLEKTIKQHFYKFHKEQQQKRNFCAPIWTQQNFCSVLIPVLPNQKDKLNMLLYFIAGIIEAYQISERDSQCILKNPHTDFYQVNKIPAIYLNWFENILKKANIVKSSDSLILLSES